MVRPAFCFVALTAGLAQAKKAREIPAAGLPSEMAHFEAAKFKLGGDEKSGAPQQVEVSVQPFSIDITAVTNAQFKEFVRATKYKTEAEKFGWSFVLEYLASDEVKASTTQTVQGAEHWLAVEHAWWRQPEGMKSGTKQRADHPVVHISWNDARNYCKWARKRLPSEVEWEWAARDGHAAQLYPWGDHPNGGGGMNVWQGDFPKENKEVDGYAGTAPATAFTPSSRGVHNMLGNVWEWTNDLFAAPPNPRGPPPEQQFVLKGGSYLDSVDGTANHKVTAATRMGNTADSGGGNTGFRCAKKGKYKGSISFKPRKEWKELEAVRAPPPPPPGQQQRQGGGRGGGRGGGGGGMPAGMDQELLQKIAAEKGVEGLQEYLAQSGSGARVMTPAQLQKMSDKRKMLKEEMAKMERGEMPSEEVRRMVERGEL
jgi:formylglycine-generating enzyme required for sulfatase activity